MRQRLRAGPVPRLFALLLASAALVGCATRSETQAQSLGVLVTGGCTDAPLPSDVVDRYLSFEGASLCVSDGGVPTRIGRFDSFFVSAATWLKDGDVLAASSDPRTSDPMAQIRSRVLTVIDAHTHRARYLAGLPGQVEQDRQMQLWGDGVLLPIIRRTVFGRQEDLALISLLSGHVEWLTDTPDTSEIAAAPAAGGVYMAVAEGDLAAGTLAHGWIEYVPDHARPQRVLDGVIADRLYVIGSTLMIAGRADSSAHGVYGVWELTAGEASGSADMVLEGPYRWPAPEVGMLSMLVTRVSAEPGGASSLIRMEIPSAPS